MMRHAAAATSLPYAAAKRQELRDAMRLPGESAELTSSATTDRTDKHEKNELAHLAYRRGRRRNQPVSRVLTAVLAFLLIGFLLTVICRRPQSRGISAGTIKRRLAQSSEGDGDSSDELEYVLQGCLEVENEYGFSAFISDLEVEEPASKKAQIYRFIYDAVREYQGAVHPFLSGVQSSTSSTAIEQRAGTTTSLNSDEYGGSFAALWSGDPALSPGTLQETESRLIQILDPLGWLESIPCILEEQGLSTDVRHEGSTEGPVIEKVLGEERGSDRPSTVSSDSDVSSSVVVEGAAASLSASPCAHQEREGAEGEGEKTSQGEPSHAISPVSKTKKPALLGEGSKLDKSPDNAEHPYTRLPVMLPGAVRRPLQLGQYRTDYAVSFSTLSLLKTIREFYLKPTLNAEEAEDLLCALETLVCVARQRLKPGGMASTPSHLTEKLATYFMIYDSIVCGAELFGSKMNFDKWWPSFTKAHKTDYRNEERRKRKGGPAFRFHVRFIHDVSAALAIYKTGVRPAKSEIIRLKRMIFCEEYSPKRFAGDRGRPWREDHFQYALAHPESSDDTEKVKEV